MKNKFIEWYKKKYSKKQRLLSLMVQAPFFIFLIPLGLWLVSVHVDNFFHFSPFLSPPFTMCLGILLLGLGFSLSLWAISVQFHIGKGTPMPVMPTQKMVVVPPYTYCRNPMALGYFLALLGFGILFRSLSFLVISTILMMLLSWYIIYVEEKELAVRFGQDYVDYKKKTPFVIPRF